MLDIEIDGKALQVEEGCTVIEAAHQLGTYIPHFCYHKKLSIAANCRMCLVQIEKAPKPMPACATPVTNGMKVFTHSELAIKAQKGVMEFLLINHPLDCPICDQGGECQLQDLAVGYGDSSSKYQEEKRVVPNKDLGSLVSTDMTRCINCTRCVRFTQEIAGNMELGQAFRGEHAEVMPFVEKTVDSELSGNIIDLCPVGALTSKPFRFAARTWELSRRKSIAAHDGLGSNLIIQTKHDKVVRVLPLENESINECWLSDRDRFSYEGLNSSDRLTRPMVKQDGKWQEVSWNVALDYVAHALRDVAGKHGPDAIGALLGAQSTLEELYLAQKVMRGMGSNNIDSRLRQTDFALDAQRKGMPWLGMSISDISSLDRVLVIGSSLRKEHPLIAQRLRQSAKQGTKIAFVNSVADDEQVKSASYLTIAPSEVADHLSQLAQAIALSKGVSTQVGEKPSICADVERLAQTLISGRQVGVFLGNMAQQHASSARIQWLATEIARLLDGKFGVLAQSANSVGAFVANAVISNEGLNAQAMLHSPRQAYVVMHAEPELDCADGAQALTALKSAAHVVVLSSFKSTAAMDYADVLLPVAPFTETSGTFINMEGVVQSFYAAVKPLGETRPAWKVLRVLGNLLNVADCEFNSSEEVKAQALAHVGIADDGRVNGLDNSLRSEVPSTSIGETAATDVLERVADVPLYFVDALVRRAPSLQATKDAREPVARLNASTASRLGLLQAQKVTVTQVSAGGTAIMDVSIDAGVPDNCVRIAAGHHASINLGAMTDSVRISAQGAV
jgi:NADH-quinone oxidoreductase subunit G